MSHELEKGSKMDSKDAVIEMTNITNTTGDKKLRRRIDLYLMPLLTISFLLQFLDKQTLSLASVMGLIQDMDLKGTQYSWSGSIFYFGYLTLSYPAAYLMVRLPLAKFLAICCIIWATVLACHAATTNFTSLAVTRFFLGAAESSLAPGFGLIISSFYTRAEQPFRLGIWFLGASFGTMFGGLFGYAIAHIHSTVLANWQWLFVILGIVTFLWGILLFFVLPSSPKDAKFLSAEQKSRAIARICENQTGLNEDRRWKWAQAVEALTDPKIWLVVIYQLAIAIPNGAVTTFMSLVISGIGFSRFEVYLLQMPVGFIHGCAALISTYICSHVKSARCWVGMGLNVIAIVGTILVRYGPNTAAKLVGFFSFVLFGSGIPIGQSMIASNVAGFTKKSVASAMMFFAYCIGNITGPFLFFPSEAKRNYPSGFTAMTICFAIAGAAVFILRIVLVVENRKRDREQGVMASEEISAAERTDEGILTDRTDGKNKSFRYLL
ncbi:uncharacterized protein A1O9_06949 [Exophiala aquamarina CBS 119918]|uniref:Major facilitator superfamily (MFS) profile domain-containing protein n=1 Tax=Exophiala aquamarina CBS 119918 TaxID=1182545 RepID=A0A072P9K1_9EURO|nr:uncharacterized protein A1O9_06949 [Exophiala aquamarina CBS 119918]KEF56759.1 hypothetical protein A1O9_06949 [Exophiala aquamarina CBS 119918]